MQYVPHIILISVLAVAIVTDLRARRIPNWLTFPAMLVALGYHVLTQGTDGLVFSLSGFGLGLAVMLVPYLLGVMGAGDVKLMAAAGAFLGPFGVLAAFICTSLVGGLYALGVLLFHLPLLKKILGALAETITIFWLERRLSYTPRTGGERLPQLAYGVAIAVGTVISMFMTQGALTALIA